MMGVYLNRVVMAVVVNHHLKKMKFIGKVRHEMVMSLTLITINSLLSTLN